MKISDLLRNLADTLDSEESITEPGALSPEIAPEEPQCLDPAPEGVFLPPLQLKMELLKKATGVDNILDCPPEEGCEQHQYPRELMQVRRNAGLPVVTTELGDEEPLDN